MLNDVKNGERKDKKAALITSSHFVWRIGEKVTIDREVINVKADPSIEKRNKNRLPWGKAMMAVVFGLCIEIVIYSEAAMWFKDDISALYALIGVPAAMVGTFWAYATKSRAENTQGGIIYEMAMLQQAASGDEDEVADDDEVPDDVEAGE